MYENDFFYAETPVPDVKFHVWNIQIHTSIQQRLFFKIQNRMTLFFLLQRNGNHKLCPLSRLRYAFQLTTMFFDNNFVTN